MSSRWVPRILLALGVLAIGAAIVSLSVGEHREEHFDISGAGEVQQLVGGIEQQGDRLGPADAPLKLELFTDLQSRECADYELDVVEPLIVDYVRTGEAQIVLHHYPLGPKPATLAGLAAEAAGLQDRQWQFASLFFRNLGEVPSSGVSREFLDEVAGLIPELEVPEWQRALDEAEGEGESEIEKLALADNDLGSELKLPVHPAFVVTGPNGSEELDDAPSLEDVEAAMDRVG